MTTTDKAPSPARLCAFNFGLQLVWGAVLAVSLQGRTRAFFGADLSQANSDAAVSAYTLIAALGAAVATVVQFAFGVISDRRRRTVGHRREFYLAGGALALPAIFWFYSAPTFPQFVAAFAALQFAMNVAIAPYQAAIPDFFERTRRGLAASWMSAYQSVGNAIGLVIAGPIAAVIHDLRLVALAIAAPFVASWLVTLAHVRRLHDVAEESGPQVSPTRALLVLLWSRGLINVGFFTLVGFLLFYVHASLGVSGDATQAQTGYLFITFIVSAAGGAAVAARPTDRRDKRLVVTLSCGVIALALAGLATAHSLPAAYSAAVLAGIGWGAFITADYALAAAVLPRGAMATSMGIWNVATTLPQIVAPLLAGPVVLRFDALAPGLGPRAAIVVSLAEFLIGAALIWRLPRV